MVAGCWVLGFEDELLLSLAAAAGGCVPVVVFCVCVCCARAGKVINNTRAVALMTQALEIGPRMRVLEIGTGCGYQTAVLCGLARRVYTIELHKELQVEAEKRLLALRFTNFTAIPEA